MKNPTTSTFHPTWSLYVVVARLCPDDGELMDFNLEIQQAYSLGWMTGYWYHRPYRS